MAELGIDAVLTQGNTGLWDFALTPEGDIETADSFDTAITVSFLTDRRARPDEVSRPELRRGWMGDEVTPGFSWGSAIWIHSQTRLETSVLDDLSDAGAECVRWMVDDQIAKGVTRLPATFAASGRPQINVRIDRPSGIPEFRHFEIWENTGVRSG